MAFSILPQPDDQTCGPTSLHAVYSYFGLTLDLQKVINDIHFLENGGTLAVFLGIDALRRGFNVTICSYNLKVWDPSWDGLSNHILIDKLNKQLQVKKGKRFTAACKAYIQFLELGGKICFALLTKKLIVEQLKNNQPILAGISATYLYKSKRELDLHDKMIYDDIRGEPSGHFIVLYGLTKGGKIKVADPYPHNPISGQSFYTVKMDRLINSILLGIITYDANLLMIRQKEL